MDNKFLRIIRQWVPLAVAISAIAFIIYLTIQQDIRIGANDPQIQIAEDLASSLEKGKNTTISGNVDVAKSLAPFIIVYDKQGNVVTSQAQLRGQTPVLPKGVLQTIENRLTWQPEEGVRLASVVVPYTNGYVLVGRNMREIEVRESQQFNNILLGWMMALVATFSCVFIMQTVMRGKK